MKKEWFEAWFDSPYYHLLYKGRDEQEAKKSLDQLLSVLHLPKGARIMDLACGRGRHAKYLAEKGFQVTGLDISEKSIAFARQFESEQLEFFQHDMRKPFRINYFDAVLNMFTSFGYFNSDREHLLAIQSISSNLCGGGLLLLDYFNSTWIKQRLVAKETKALDGVTFSLKRWIEDEHVHKTVSFDYEGQPVEFTESVRLFELADFERFYEACHLKLIHTYGDYAGSPFDPTRSARLIMVAQKQ